MAYEMKDNSGSMFRNDRKEKQTHADYKGSAMIDGREYWMSAWIKNADDPAKKTFMSFAFDPKEARDDGPVMDKGQSGRDENIDDSIPF